MQVPLIIDPAFLHTIKRHVLLLSKVTVVRHPRGRKKRSSQKMPAPKKTYPLVAIAASLGGPKALVSLLCGIPPNFGAAIVICQHITPGFSGDLARWLASESGHNVTEAMPGAHLEQGSVLIAPAHIHLLVKPGGVIEFDDGPPVGGFKPRQRF